MKRWAGCCTVVALIVSSSCAVPAMGQLFPNARAPRGPAPTPYEPHGEVRIQAAGLGLLYGGFFGFAVGSHIDRRSKFGRSSDDAAAALLLAGALSGTLGGLVWGAGSSVEPGRLGLAASSVLWGGVLTFGVRSAMGRGDDMRSPLLAGTALAVVSWHLWDDIELTRGMSWFIDAGGTLGLFVAGIIAGSMEVGSEEPSNNDETTGSDARRFMVFTGIFAGMMAATTYVAWLLNDPPRKVRPHAALDIGLAPLPSKDGGLGGLSFVGRF